jgi:hypothetical protein
MLEGRFVDLRKRRVGGLQLVGLDRHEVPVGSTRVGDDGHFVLPVQLAEGALLRVGLELGDFLLGGDEVRVKNGFSWVDVYLHAAAKIDLCVVPATGLRGRLRAACNSFAEVTVTAVDSPHAVAATTTTDHRGAFAVLGLTGGRWTVTAVASDGEVLTAEVDVAEHAVAEVAALAPAPAGTIEGRVRDAAGAPLPGAKVQLWYADPALPKPAPWMRQAITDRHGNFRCRGVHAGEWRASVANDPGMDFVIVSLRDRETGVVALQAQR